MQNKTLIFVILAILLLVTILFFRTAQAPDPTTNGTDTPSEIAVPTHDEAEMTGFNFMQDVILVAPPVTDAEAAQRIYQALSSSAREQVGETTVSADIARFLGIQDVPDLGVSVEDLQVSSDEEVTLILGLNYSGGRTFRALTMIVEDGEWKVDSVAALSEYPIEEAPGTPAEDDFEPSRAGDKGGEEPTPPPVSVGNNACVVAGCSGQLCVDASMSDIMTTCEWLEEYACYREATCERQSDGECGWTPTNELQMCIQEARATS
jgi:hypothetical protein